MNATAHETYLNTQVMTATPQKLQLMMIDGAIRFAKQGLALWQKDDLENATESLIRCRRIVTEILGGVKQDGSELPQQISAIYTFVFRLLTEAQIEQNQEKINDVVKILEVEQDTWRQVCEKIALSENDSSGTSPSASSLTAANLDAPARRFNIADADRWLFSHGG